MSVRSKRWMVRGVAAVAGGACALIVGAGSLSAHVGVDQDEIEAGSSATLGFSFSHGCEDSPTTSMSFQVPEGVNNAVPLAHAGWDIEVEREELAEPIESAHGDPITDRPAVITFTAREGFIVPSGVKDTMSLSFTAPEAPGQLFFKVIQGCEVGSNDWIDEWDGTGEEPESPAPSVMVVAATGERRDRLDGAGDHDWIGRPGDDGRRRRRRWRRRRRQLERAGDRRDRARRGRPRRRWHRAGAQPQGPVIPPDSRPLTLCGAGGRGMITG